MHDMTLILYYSTFVVDQCGLVVGPFLPQILSSLPDAPISEYVTTTLPVKTMRCSYMYRPEKEFGRGNSALF